MRNLALILLLVAALSALYFVVGSEDQPGAELQTATEETDPAAAIRAKSASLNTARILQADSEPGNWLSHGRTYSEARFSPLDQINAENVSQLGLAWYFDTNTNRGLEATPIVVDGVMYTSGAWSLVWAHDARDGRLLWEFDPQVPKEWGVYACCDVVNRGVAVWEGKVFVGTLDGRLVALDAGDGSLLWEVNTIDKNYPYTITGAPRVINGKVIIGNGGAELGVRGYVSAYDVNTGQQHWRFYTVPGNPADGFESEILEKAAETWNGEWWTLGGGGTVWDSMAYDPELNQLYIGIGNGSPWNQTVRSPGGGDNLFLSSIVALNPDTGEYIWHYQTTPGETWDYTATQHMILADVEIEGELRKVIMQAPKNGFFYVLDRKTGEFISAENYVPISWASHVDPATGRPVETANARYQAANPLAELSPEQQLAALKQLSDQELEGAFHKPGPLGGHNWHPMSYSPVTGLVYIPALDMPFAYGNHPKFSYEKGRWNLAINNQLNAPTGDSSFDDRVDGLLRGHISAWDPVQQKEVWRVQHAGPWSGGLLSTAGNLVFQGNSSGEFVAYRADTGAALWSAPAQTGVIAPPITYSIDGEQYVTVVAGWGGAFPLTAGGAANKLNLDSRGRILTFKLGANKKLPPLAAPAALGEIPPLQASAEEIQEGKMHYHDYCGVCHGPGVQGGGVIPDLRHMDGEKYALFEQIVYDGIYASAGMVSFGDVLSREEVATVKAYVWSEAKKLRDSQRQDQPSGNN